MPAAVRAKAVTSGAAAWLEELPGLVAGIERDWGISVGRVFGDASEAYVAEAVCADGTPAVLKLIVPRAGGHAANEIAVLRIAGGEGCVRLLRSDVDRSALLMERLGPALSTLDLPIDRRHEILAGTAARLWRPAPDSGLPTGAEKGRWLVEFVEERWETLGRPCHRTALDAALAAARSRIAAHRDDRAVLVHGDVHQWNTLRDDDGWSLVDPDGLLAEPEYDLGVILREDPVELLAGDPYDRARVLAARTGLDPAAIWEWGMIERVSTGLVLTTIGAPDGPAMLATAEALA